MKCLICNGDVSEVHFSSHVNTKHEGAKPMEILNRDAETT
jgi:hypothetical protein